MRLLLGVFSLFLLANMVHAATYYVATNGDDSNPGTSSQPWRSISAALSRVQGGDTVIVKDGTYTGTITTSRSFSDWVTLKAEHPYNAKLTNPSSGSVLGIYTKGSAKIIIEGFEITSSTNYDCGGRRQGNYLMHIQDAQDVIIRNNVIHGNNAPGACNELLKINRGGDPYYPKNIVVEGNLFYDHVSAEGADMIDSVRPGELTITGNIFFARNSPNAQSFITLKREVLRNNPMGITPRSPRHIIARNIFLNYDGKNDQAFIQLGEDEQNQVMISDALIENNLLIGNSPKRMAAPFQFKGASDIVVRANTIVGDYSGASAFGFRIGTEGSNPQVRNIRIYNNIFADPTGTMGGSFINTYGRVDTSTIVLRNNLFWNNGNPLPPSESPPPASDTQRVEGDPKLNPDQSSIVLPVWDDSRKQFLSGKTTIRDEFVRLVQLYGAIGEGSAAIDAADKSNMPQDDILGNARDSSPDIGAFEFGGRGGGNRQEEAGQGDLNSDGRVDFADLMLVALNYGKSGGFNPLADANKDGRVDFADLMIVALNYGKAY